MKLVYVANIRMPTEKAHGIQIMKMCEAFANNGMAVELLVPDRYNDLNQDPFDFYNVKRNFKLIKIPCLDLVNFDFARIGFLTATLSFLISVKLRLRKEQPYFLYSREPLTGLFFRNHILEIHLLPGKIGPLYKYLLNRSRKIFCLTGFLKEDLIRWGIVSEKLKVLPDAVDLADFDIAVPKEDAREKLKFPVSKKIVLYTGSFLLYDWKGVDVLLDAVQSFPEDYQVVLVGGHPWEMEKIRREYKSDKLTLVPYARHYLMPVYLKAADILVIPNKKGDEISERHTSPLKVFEYMASKRPIVSSNLPSLREILTEKEAVFFEPNNSEDLANKVKGLMENPREQEFLTQNAYSKVRGYTWEGRAREVIGLL